MSGFTGIYNGCRVSVMGSGMGMPSMGIYSYELYNVYDVDNIIRIGSAGAFDDDLNLMDIVLGMGSCTDSNFAAQYNLPGVYAPIADFTLLKTAYDVAEEKHFSVKVGNVLASDVFYNDDTTVNDRWKKMGVLAVDMESAALYMTAARCRKHALTILTISDHLYRGEKLSAQERQTGFTKMMETALETAVRLQNNKQMEVL
jgi:purine-nucleoside phosphorylase